MKDYILKIMKKYILFFAILITIPALASENERNIEYEDGLNFIPADSTFKVNMNLIFQPRMTVFAPADDLNSASTEYLIRRTRLRFGGWALDPSITYFLHFAFSQQDMESTGDPSTDYPGVIFDAYIRWNFLRDAWIQFGQFKLPANLSRQMSFTDLNFNERSEAEGRFTPYRDMGFMLGNEFSIANIVSRQYFAWTNGEGKNRFAASGGMAYTGRLEILPLGNFKGGGDRTEMDLENEKSPKLLVGGAISINQDAQRSRGTLGGSLLFPVDQTTYMADILVKYRGFAAMAEYYKREADGNPIQVNLQTGESAIIYEGNGYSAQASYHFCGNTFALRYTSTDWNELILPVVPKYEDITFGYSRHLFKNKLKLQGDLGFLRFETPNDPVSENLYFRLQAVLSI